jgi:hypothetical protein
MAAISSNPETIAVCQDWMVELSGFEPMAIAGRCHLELDRR